MNIYEIFLEMKNVPRGAWIENPYDLIETDFIVSIDILGILQTSNQSVSFTRLSLKHLAEKGDIGEYFICKIQEVLEGPEAVYLGNFKNRFLISKMIHFESDSKAHVITLEITENMGNILVTGFISKDAYFKNLRLLWGTASPHLNNP